MGLLAENRHGCILDYLRNNGRVIVKEVAEKFHVTEVTIRRDLASLEAKGLVKKTYGGAILAGSEFNPSVKFRHTKNLSFSIQNEVRPRLQIFQAVFTAIIFSPK